MKLIEIVNSKSIGKTRTSNNYFDDHVSYKYTYNITEREAVNITIGNILSVRYVKKEYTSKVKTTMKFDGFFKSRKKVIEEQKDFNDDSSEYATIKYVDGSSSDVELSEDTNPLDVYKIFLKI